MKKKYTIFSLLTVGVLPFIISLVQFLKKGSDDPVTRKDLLIIFAIQLALLSALAAKVYFYNYLVLAP